jgi:NAD(P)-dependent dehydrogenase (short-subunit alcohol dehydrogenase family)
VAVAARTRSEVDETAAAITGAGGTALAVTADVTLTADVEALVRTTTSELGPPDILVNDAGIQLTRQAEPRDHLQDLHRRSRRHGEAAAHPRARAVSKTNASTTRRQRGTAGEISVAQDSINRKFRTTIASKVHVVVVRFARRPRWAVSGAAIVVAGSP